MVNVFIHKGKVDSKISTIKMDDYFCFHIHLFNVVYDFHYLQITVDSLIARYLKFQDKLERIFALIEVSLRGEIEK